MHITRAGGARSSFGKGWGRGRGQSTQVRDGIGKSNAQQNTSHALVQARVYALNRDEALAAPEVITSKISFNNPETFAFALIDPGFSHSFISSHMALQTPREPKPL